MSDQEDETRRFTAVCEAAKAVETILNASEADFRWAIARCEETQKVIPEGDIKLFYIAMTNKLKAMVFCANWLRQQL